VNIYDPYAYTTRCDVPGLKERTVTTAPINRYGVYAQDLLSIGEKFYVLLGVRYTHQTTESEVLTVANDSTAATTAYAGATTPRFGILYQPVHNVSLFASYATSFTLNTGVDVRGAALPPSYLNQWEAGVKSIVANGALSITATAYRILNDNLAQISLADGNTNANIKELAGSVVSKGGELDLSTAAWRGISARAGYSYNHTSYLRSNTYEEGSMLRYNPAHTVNATVLYDFDSRSIAKGLMLGAAAYHAAGRFAGRSTRVQVANDAYRLIELPDYTTLDVFAGYTFRSLLSLRLRVSNVTDVLSYNAHDDNSINPIASRQYSATISYRF
jgi:iron complex outermembrane receptor protein